MTTQTANALRFLSMDTVQAANSGHPGAPMGMADMADVLWREFLRHNPKNPKFANRDRFVLSNGHASALLYSLLHLSGYNLSADDLKNFRQLHSKTPGHPEYHDTPGVELTTGPLGQGIATAVGFAIAERHMAARYNRERLPLVDHYTYVFAGDGCLMEGVSSEACSLAGTLGLGKLICLYDSNGISIDGEIAPWFGEDTALRYEAYGWQVIRDVDGHDHAALDAAISAAKAETGKPTLIICRTKIGYGSPNLQGTEKTHGAPLGKEEIALTKQALGLPAGDFELPPDAYQIASLREKGAKLQDEWERIWQEYQDKYPMEAQEYARVMSGKLPDGLDRVIESTLAQYNEAGGAIATRKASENAINLLAPLMPELIGGSADLTGSNLTWSKAASKSILPGDFSGNYLHYGVREFAMATIMNGLALYGGLRAYGGTFLVFSDYMRNGIRLSALMKLPVTYVLTHDSIGLGEDGPTHQPIEQTATLRMIPNMAVWRPCDSVESLVAWAEAIKAPDHPSTLIFSRQNLKFLQRSEQQLNDIRRGGYVISEAQGDAKAVIIATGSEVELALDAQAALAKEGIAVRVVSMPSTNIFDLQDAAYRNSVLPAALPRVAVEAGLSQGWYKYVGLNGATVGIDRFGESAPAEVLFKEFGFTVENVVKVVKSVL